ncbi:TniQ family protein [Streptomyces sp. NPDC005336]|uniref:TniQ family protein n=1 Tax=Streptomyces sp. NPDC005336 TaxID=3157035 RepID=UPI0033B4921C
MKELRTLAIRALPLPGESIDSWLEALARRSWTSLSALLEALGVPVYERTHRLLVAPSSKMLRQLEAQTGLPQGHLDQTVIPPGLVGRYAPRWRFCPQCLRESDGRWLTRWWLPWSLACAKHKALLQSVCPSCLKEPREFLPRPVHVNAPGRCLHPTGLRSVCGADLSAVPALDLEQGHPLAQAQLVLDRIAITRTTNTGSVFAHAEECLDRLTQAMTSSDLPALDGVLGEAWERLFITTPIPLTEFAAWRLRERGSEILTRELLRQEYQQDGKPLRQIADDYSLPRKYVVERARELGIPVYRGNRPHVFDDEWLRDQYVNQIRTADDIGQELGTDGNVVRRRLDQLGVPRRLFGVHSWPIMNRKLDDSVPADIRKATEGNLHGWLRLRRFQILTAFPTLTTAASYLKVRPSMLTGQFNRLEADLGAELFHRSVRHAAQHPTSRGASLLRDINDPQAQNLMREALGPKLEPMPSRAEIASAEAMADGMDARLTSLSSHLPAPDHLHIPPPIVPLLKHLFEHVGQETYAAQIQSRTGLSRATIQRQLKCFAEAGWLTARDEPREERPKGGRCRIYYSLTVPARRIPIRDLLSNPRHLRKRTPPRDETQDTTVGQSHEPAGQRVTE